MQCSGSSWKDNQYEKSFLGQLRFERVGTWISGKEEEGYFKASALGIYLYIMNYHNTWKGSKHLLSHSFYGSRIQVCLSWVLQGLSSGCGHLKHRLEENQLSGSLMWMLAELESSCRLLHRFHNSMVLTSLQQRRESIQDGRDSLLETILAAAFHCICHISFSRNESVSAAHTRRKEIMWEHEWIPGGRAHWGLHQRLPPTRD